MVVFVWADAVRDLWVGLFPLQGCMLRLRTILSPFSVAMLSVVVVAMLLPARGDWAVFFDWATRVAIGLLFFLHGAKLPRRAILAGALHWRLHVAVFVFTFVVFPVIGMVSHPWMVDLLGNPLAEGVLYLCALPATVQSAIAFTSIARGNVPAAVCSASASSLLGILLTPFLVNLMMASGGGQAEVVGAVMNISVQLLLPFLAGHLARCWIGRWVDRNQRWLKQVDQGSILFVVYTAFSGAVVGGVWSDVSWFELGLLVVVSCILLVVVLASTWWAGRLFGFAREDRIALVFCGSKKSLASGVPMAHVLFSGGVLGPMLLPVMIFHQIQLIVCAVLAERWGREVDRVGG